MSRTAFTPTQVVTRLASLTGWALSGDGDQVAIEKTFRFANFHETMGFVNALAFQANRHDHHPDLSVHYGHCVVRWRTHDAGGLTQADFDSAARTDALLNG